MNQENKYYGWSKGDFWQEVANLADQRNKLQLIINSKTEEAHAIQEEIYKLHEVIALLS